MLWLVNLRPNATPQIRKGLIAGLIKGNQWLISPDHKALFLAGYVRGGRLTSDDVAVADVLFLHSCQFLRKFPESVSQTWPQEFSVGEMY